MTAVARYVLAEHLRSRRFAGPALVLVAGLIVLYSQAPGPALSTAGGVAAFLFLDLCWWSLSLLNTQGDADRHIFVAAVGRRSHSAGRLLALLALSAAVSVIAVGLPALAGRFDPMPGVGEVGICLLGTFTCAVAGCATGAPFSRPGVGSPAIAVLGLTGAAVLAVPLGLSPGIATARALDVSHPGAALARLMPVVFAVLAFAAAVAIACMLLWRRLE